MIGWLVKNFYNRSVQNLILKSSINKNTPIENVVKLSLNGVYDNLNRNKPRITSENSR